MSPFLRRIPKLCVWLSAILIAGAAPAAYAQSPRSPGDMQFLFAFGALTGPEGKHKAIPVQNDMILRSGERLKLFIEPKNEIYVYLKKIAEAIPAKGGKPALLGWVPSEGLRTNLIPYFHKPVILNIHYYLADANILNLNEKTDAVLARYHGNQSRVRLLICGYPGAGEAREAFERFCKIYFSGRGKGLFLVENTGKGGFVSAQVMNRALILVFEASDEETCRRLTEAVIKRMKGSSK